MFTFPPSMSSFYMNAGRSWLAWQAGQPACLCMAALNRDCSDGSGVPWMLGIILLPAQKTAHRTCV
jgi:hypothetical protein